MDTKEWAEKYCPHFLRAYERSQIPFDILVPGTKLLMLRAGFSGMAGVTREVVEIKTEKTSKGEYRYALLTSPRGDQSILLEDDDREGPWYFSALVLTPEDVNAREKMSTRQRDTWEAEKLGIPICNLKQVASLKGWDRP